jgi:hypothetical protein
MTRVNDGVKCTVHDGAVWLHLDCVPALIPSQLVNKSQILMDAMSSEDALPASKHFTLDAPKEWLQAWLACYVYGGEEDRLRCADVKELVNCLLVPLYASIATPATLITA